MPSSSVRNMMRSSGSVGRSIWPYAIPRVLVRTETMANRSAPNTSYHPKFSGVYPVSFS